MAKKKDAMDLSKAAKLISKNATKILPVDLGELDLRSFGKLGKKVRKFIRRNPAKAVLIGVGIGMALSKSDGVRNFVDSLLLDEKDLDLKDQFGLEEDQDQVQNESEKAA